MESGKNAIALVNFATYARPVPAIQCARYHTACVTEHEFLRRYCADPL